MISLTLILNNGGESVKVRSFSTLVDFVSSDRQFFYFYANKQSTSPYERQQ